MRLTKYDRLLYILNLLRSRRNLTAGKLAAECGVTERTIYRDIVALSEANIPIYFDNGYKYASGNFLPPLNFNVDEYTALKKILETTPLSHIARDKKIIKSIKTKIDAVLLPAVKKEAMFRQGPADVTIRASMADTIPEKIYSAVEECINRNLVLSLEYNSIESGLTNRQVEPYFMIFIERAFYFVAHCRLRKDLRTFRLDRIAGAQPTDKAFKPRADISPEEYFENSWGVFSGEPHEVEIIFTGKAARVIQLGKHHPAEKITDLGDGAIRYEVKVSGLYEISRWILGFGGEAKVAKPEKLKKIVTSTAKQIAANYPSKKL